MNIQLPSLLLYAICLISLIAGLLLAGSGLFGIVYRRRLPPQLLKIFISLILFFILHYANGLLAAKSKLDPPANEKRSLPRNNNK